MARFNCRSIGPARTSWPDQMWAKRNLKQEQNIKFGHAKVFILLQRIERMFIMTDGHEDQEYIYDEVPSLVYNKHLDNVT